MVGALILPGSFAARGAGASGARKAMFARCWRGSSGLDAMARFHAGLAVYCACGLTFFL